MVEPEYIQANGFIAEVQRTNRRKTASIKVEEGLVTVVVPQALTIERIEALLEAKRSWVIDKIAQHQQATPTSEKFFVSGEAFPYLGRNYRLKVETGDYKPAKLVNGRILVTLPTGARNTPAVRNALARWYHSSAYSKLKPKVRRYAKMIGLTPNSIGIKSFKSRWGSCSAKGDIDFNWVIVMAPNRIVDYVVVHELCHLIHHDHSANFWKEVERVIPDYTDCREWLRENSDTLKL